MTEKYFASEQSKYIWPSKMKKMLKSMKRSYDKVDSISAMSNELKEKEEIEADSELEKSLKNLENK